MAIRELRNSDPGLYDEVVSLLTLISQRRGRGSELLAAVKAA